MAIIRAFHLGLTHQLPVRSSKTMNQMRNMSYYNKAFINGAWVNASSNKVFDVKNPYDGKVLTSVPDMDVKDVQSAIDSAKCAFEDWKNTTGKERSILLRSWYNLLEKNKEELAKVITAEAGKPLPEALGEVAYGNSFIDWFAEEARRIHGELLSSPFKTKEMILVKQPIGVAALITPWNFPIAMITRKAGAALAAGCTCVVKPAEDTPLTALAVAALAHEAGIPKGVINVVTCDRANAPSVGKLLCESPDVAGLSFTGSTEVGKILYRQCASGVKRLGLELGGNAPFVVFDSADIEKAVNGAMASKFRNCGQTCVSANRFLIHSKIFDAFVNKLKLNVEKELTLGDGANPKCNMGPLINKNQATKVNNIVQDAVKKGAKVIIGGKLAKHIGENFFEPTILTNISSDMECYTEEIFGPIVVCIRFETETEAIAIANDTRRGLAGYFYSEDISQIWRVAKNIEVGMVGINEGIISAAEAAFGGIKESGIGREGSHHGVDDFTYIKYMCFGNL